MMPATEEAGTLTSTKAANLRRLADAGFRVPPFVTVPAGVFRQVVDALRSAGLPLKEENLYGIALSAEVVDSIQTALAQLPDPIRPIAVRSSMAGEDGAHHAFAGQLDSFLNVARDPAAGDPAVVEAVRACWASAFGRRVAAYREAHGLASAGDSQQSVIGAMEVILQHMVAADAAGVVFTTDPVTGDRSRIVISVARGLGVDLVQGEATGETLSVDRVTGVVDWPDAEGLPHGQSRPLSEDQAREVAELVVEIEELFGTAQDVEFAVAGGEVWILQARPITAAGDIAGRRNSTLPRPWLGDEVILWDNANIAESYSGITSPLTRSVIRRAYAGVYAQFLALMGVRDPDPAILQNLLGFHSGRVYYQLQNWYAALALLPAFNQNRAFMEQMMGAKSGQGTRIETRSSGWIAGVTWGMRMVWLHRRSESMVRAFLAHVDEVVAEHRAADLDRQSPRQLLDRFRDLETRVLGRWQAPILTDFFAMIFFGLLRRLCARWAPDWPVLHNALLVGDGAIESLKPMHRVAELAEEVGLDARLSALFAGAEPLAIWETVRTNPAHSAFLRSLEDYLDRYGDRCMNELKLETPTLRDEPERLVALVRAVMRTPRQSVPVSERSTPAATRQAAERRLRQLSWPRRLFLGWILDHARRHVRNRENMRFARTRVFGLLRAIFNAAGRHYAKAGLILKPEDVYFLTEAEVWDVVTGTATSLDLAGLVALRRTERDRNERLAPPDRFQTLGVPYDQPLIAIGPTAGARATDQAAPVDSHPADLRGVPCSAGRVTGRVRVVLDVDAATNLEGDVLVALRTDPGWIFLFPSASALLVEHGSPLAHSAIVARELGLPAIVNIPGLTRRLQTRDRVTIDGTTGEVWVLAEDAGSETSSGGMSSSIQTSVSAEREGSA